MLRRHRVETKLAGLYLLEAQGFLHEAQGPQGSIVATGHAEIHEQIMLGPNAEGGAKIPRFLGAAHVPSYMLG